MIPRMGESAFGSYCGSGAKLRWSGLSGGGEGVWGGRGIGRDELDAMASRSGPSAVTI